MANDDFYFYHYSDLIHLRKEHPIVLTGEYRVLNPEDEQVYAYLRVNSAEDAAAASGERALLVVANFTQETLSLPYADGQLASLALKNPGVLNLRSLRLWQKHPN